jgi:hypothetical protein
LLLASSAARDKEYSQTLITEIDFARKTAFVRSEKLFLYFQVAKKNDSFHNGETAHRNKQKIPPSVLLKTVEELTKQNAEFAKA